MVARPYAGMTGLGCGHRAGVFMYTGGWGTNAVLSLLRATSACVQPRGCVCVYVVVIVRVRVHARLGVWVRRVGRLGHKREALTAAGHLCVRVHPQGRRGGVRRAHGSRAWGSRV